jgi:hypothetical protein
MAAFRLNRGDHRTVSELLHLVPMVPRSPDPLGVTFMGRGCSTDPLLPNVSLG